MITARVETCTHAAAARRVRITKVSDVDRAAVTRHARRHVPPTTTEIVAPADER